MVSATLPPPALQHLHNRQVQKSLQKNLPRQNARHAQDQEVAGGEEQAADDSPMNSSTCPGSPFLWKIVEDTTDKHVGFGVGTIHLPSDLVTTDGAFASILSAVEDSCDVYGEVDLLDAAVIAEVAQCAAPIIANAARVADIPEEEVRNVIIEELTKIATLVNPDDADFVADLFLTFPLFDVTNTIQLANTPEYREQYLETLRTGVETGFLDTDLLALGRPNDSLEEVSAQCDAIELLYPTPVELNDKFQQGDATYMFSSTNLEAGLNGTYTNIIQDYKCGDIDAFTTNYNIELAKGSDGTFEEVALKNRNIKMAANMTDILKARSTDEKILFAVGNAHWLIGNYSLDVLLPEYGYRLEPIPDWGMDDAENLSNEQCQVKFDASANEFIPVGEQSSPTSSPTHSPTPSCGRSRTRGRDGHCGD